jgi:hypothetical protein
MLFATLADESNLQWLVFAALALVYGSAVMTIVIVTLIKSARARASETSKKGYDPIVNSPGKGHWRAAL